MTTRRYSRSEAEKDLKLLAQDEKAGLIRDWLSQRPKSIQDLYAKYPPNRFYRVRAGAPYRFTGEGCIVAIQSYFEGGEVRIRVLKNSEGNLGVDAAIDPKWLDPISLDEAFPYEN